MLDSIKAEEILFLDIETVPQFPTFDLLDEETKHLWTEKSKYLREKNNLTLPESYESAGIYAEFGKVICISVGFFTKQNSKQVFRVTSFYGDDEKQVLQDFAALLNDKKTYRFNLLCAHNGKEFDFPYMCRRMLVNAVSLPGMLDMAGKKPWEIAHLDTMELWKFGDFKHYTSLKLLAHIMGIPTPKDDIDGSQVKRVYYQENDLSRIERYCKKDVITVAQIFLRYKNMPLIDEADIVSA
jgi:3'-5' exonuclease